MGVTAFRFDRGLAADFVDFAYAHHRNDAAWIPPMRTDAHARMQPEFEFYTQPGNRHRHFLARANGRVVGRVSASVHAQCRHPHGGSLGAVGQFECVDDFDVARDLLDHAVAWLRDAEVAHVWGPLDFDIWHGYRFMTAGFDRERFLGEPHNAPYYPELFQRYGFTPLQTWTSIEVDGSAAIDRLHARWEPRYRRFLERGVRFEPANLSCWTTEVDRMHALVTDSFSGFPGFTPISRAEFRRLFSAGRHAVRSELLNFVRDVDHRHTAFVSAFLDIARAARAMHGRDGLSGRLRFLWNRRHVDRVIIYMGGKAKHASRAARGLGVAGLGHTVTQIRELGFERLLVALMAEGSPIRHILHEAGLKGQREYALYELTS